MKSKSKKLFFLFVPIIAFMFLGAVEAGAQAGECDIITAVTRTTRPLGPAFFTEANRPYFYIDIHTQGCMNETIKVSITEDDWGVDDDVNGTLGIGQTCNNGNNSCMDNRVINVTSATTGSFTLALITGEDECQISGDPDCQYHIETWDEVDSGFEWPQVSGYDCRVFGLVECDLNWQYLGIIPYGDTHANDPDLVPGSSGSIPVDGSSSGSIPVTGPNGGSTIINLNLPNPLAGTVDTLPEFFQKVVYIIIKIGVPLVAMAIVFAGFLFVTARGSDEQLKKAKLAFTFAIIGGLILLASWAVADAIKDALTTINNP